MWKILSSKIFWLYTVLLFIIIGFFSFSQVASRNSVKIRKLPVALVNSSGSQYSRNIVKRVKNKFSNSDAQIKFINVNSIAKLNSGLTNKKYYAALIIDKNFDAKLALQQNYLKGLIIKEKLSNLPDQAIAQSAQLKAQAAFAKQAVANSPRPGKIKVVINQGMNAQAVQVLTALLPKLAMGLNQGIAKKMQAIIQQNSISLSNTNWQIISNPIQVQTKIKNKIPENSINGMAPMIIVILAWIGSLIGTMLLWREHKKYSNNNRLSMTLISSQVITGAVMTIVASLSIYFFSSVVFGLTITNTISFISLLIFNIFIFYLLQTCVLDWLGFIGLPFIILIWLLSVGTISYAPEMLSPLFRQGIYSWIPMRFSTDMFTNHLYIHGSSITTQTDFLVLSLIGLVALVLTYLSSLLKRKA